MEVEAPEVPATVPDGGFAVLVDLPVALRTRVELYAKRLLTLLNTKPELVEVLRARHLAAAQEEASGDTLGDLVRTAGRKTTKKAVETEVKRKVVTDAGADDVGHTAKGKWTPEGVASGAASKSNIRDRQLANQISAVLLESGAKGSSEVEVMLIHGRILVSANEKASLAKLHGKKLGELIDGIDHGRLPAHVKPKARKLADIHDALRGRDSEMGQKRLAQIAVDCVMWPDQAESVRAALLTLWKNEVIVNGGVAGQAAARLRDEKLLGRVITVDGEEVRGTKIVSARDSSGAIVKGPDHKAVKITIEAMVPRSHAEQNLVLTQVLAGHTGPSAVAGGKRPCTVCYLSLSLVRNHGYGSLRFSNHPGGYWHSTTVGALTKIAQALGMDKDALVEALDQIPFKVHYVTDLDHMAERSAPVAALRESLTAYRTKMSSPSQSLADEDFIGRLTPDLSVELEDEDWFGEAEESSDIDETAVAREDHEDDLSDAEEDLIPLDGQK